MNKEKLKKAEENFFIRYPGGFSNPLMLEISKKHKVEKMHKLAKACFAIEEFDNPNKIIEAMNKIVSQSSLVSLFEKPKFRDLVKILNDNEKELLAKGLMEFLHGDQELGFEIMTGLLTEYKLAKWPILTVCSVYYNPSVEVLIKPTTVKGVIEFFELEGLKYNSKPSYEFYRAYREQINLMKNEVDGSFREDNSAFCGFLMYSMDSKEYIASPGEEIL